MITVIIVKNKSRQNTLTIIVFVITAAYCHYLIITHITEAVLNVQTDKHAHRHVETQTNRLRTISEVFLSDTQPNKEVDRRTDSDTDKHIGHSSLTEYKL